MRDETKTYAGVHIKLSRVGGLSTLLKDYSIHMHIPEVAVFFELFNVLNCRLSHNRFLRKGRYTFRYFWQEESHVGYSHANPVPTSIPSKLPHVSEEPKLW